MKYRQQLPPEVEAQLDAYIERIKNIKWFAPSPELKKSDIDTQVSVALKAFGVEASIEYRSLRTPKDWDAAKNAAWDAAKDAAWDAAWDAASDAASDAAWDAAWDAARNAAWDAAKDAAWDAAWDAAKDAAWDAASGAVDVLALNIDAYKAKHPTGNFIHIIPLWEAGLYPCGVIDGKFVIYVPPCKTEFPSDLV